MLIDYKEKQGKLYDFLTKSSLNNKISHAYLLETNGVSYAEDFALDMAKFFLSDNLSSEEKNYVCNLIDNGNYPDLKVISADKMIKKEQMMQLMTDFKNKPLYGKYMIYIINDIAKLNTSSANTILKFLEEPSENVIAILIVDNVSLALETIVSRCQILTLVNDGEDLFSDLSKKYDCSQDDYLSAINYYFKLESLKRNFLIDDEVYGLRDHLGLLFSVGFYLYSDVLRMASGLNLQYFGDFADNCNQILENNEIYDIISKIDIISKFLENSNYNINKDLFIDSFVISMIGVR